MNSVTSILFSLILVLTSVVCFGNIVSATEYPANLKQLHQNIWADLLKGAPENDNSQKVADKLNEKGEWPDIDYSSKQRGDWPPSIHLSRLQVMARAYQREGSSRYHDARLLAKIQLALNYWLEHDLQCPNWWYPEIGVPMSLAPTLILMETELSKDQLASGIRILDRARIRMTGQNKVWLSGNVLLKSLLLRDAETIGKASASIQEELKVSLEEGIQPDNSFHQHGPQIQFGNYGLAYAGDMIKWIRLLRNTPFGFDENKMAILRNYLIEGQQWIVWKNQMDISACGRQLFVDAQKGKANGLENAIRQMEVLDPGYAGAYQKANQYETLSGNRHFWNSDFQVQRSPAYYFSVKMCSERVIGAESCNSENIRGYYLGDGATYLYQSGKEYENIFPFWDWKKIPGTTTHQNDVELPVLTASGYRIKSKFVGGVSDGKNGMAVMDYNRDGITARKAWFNFNDMIVCLGSGINSKENFDVATTINQCFLHGDVIAKEKTEKAIPAESSLSFHPTWILHDQTGYFFPDGGNLRLETKTAPGSWNQVALMYKPETIQAGLFKLWFDHAKNPVDAKYTYILVPGATTKKLQGMESKPAFTILKNDTTMQAVLSADKSIGGAVFYNAGIVDLSGRIEVNSPCVVMMKMAGKDLNISISDPTHLLDQVNLKLAGKYVKTDSHVPLQMVNGNTLLEVTMPKGGEAGKTVTFLLKAL